MKLLEVKTLAIPEIKVIRYGRFRDQRGYFTETMRRSDIDAIEDTLMLSGEEIVQGNESLSRAGTIRGMHFQWNPYMGKLVRTLSGRMIDMVLDIRKGSPTLGKIVLYDMPADADADYGEWIWVPPGFAHGNLFPVDTLIEYLCTGEYSPGCEAGLSPVAADIDWSLCDPDLKVLFDAMLADPQRLISEKDEKGLSLDAWLGDERSENFLYKDLKN